MAAAAILHAAEHAERDIYVGGVARAIVAAGQVAPGMLDTASARMGTAAQQRSLPARATDGRVRTGTGRRRVGQVARAGVRCQVETAGAWANRGGGGSGRRGGQRDVGASPLRRLLPLLLLSGCAEPVCRPMVEAQLFFGLTDEAAFGRFMDTAVTPRFPAGSTVLNAAGRWRAPDGTMTQERSASCSSSPSRVRRRWDGCRRSGPSIGSPFRQQSVGLTIGPVCADF